MDELTIRMLPKKVQRYLGDCFDDIVPSVSEPPEQSERLRSQLEDDVSFVVSGYAGPFPHVPTADLAMELVQLADDRENEPSTEMDPVLVRSVTELRTIADGLYKIATVYGNAKQTRF